MHFAKSFVDKIHKVLAKLSDFIQNTEEEENEVNPKP